MEIVLSQADVAKHINVIRTVVRLTDLKSVYIKRFCMYETSSKLNTSKNTSGIRFLVLSARKMRTATL